MRILSIDIETFSDVDLGRCGMYRYADSPNFDILLFGYSIDGGSVKLIDICSVEELPQFIIDALIDDDVTKTAFNAQFERVCLMKYLSRLLHRNIYLDPSSWSCTEVQASMLGLPLSLVAVGKVLKLDEQKMDEGKALIRYFCTPCRATAANGGRTRNMPKDAPEKWELFKKYNIRDVQVEIAIREKLKKYPIPEKEQEFYILDQKINDRGLLVDMELVKQAVFCNKQFTVAATERAYELTGLENPNSVAQLKGWLKERGVEVESLSKKAVTELIDETEGEVEEALKLRLLMAKTSVKKYEAVERAVCLDGRVHGLFQFYGANRTGRWCLTGDHEVLTSDGWMRLDKWTGGEIACWSSTTEFISFQKAKTLKFDYEGKMYLLESQRCSQLSTPDHKMPYWNKKGFWDVDVISSLSKKRFSIPYTGRRITNCSLEHKELRILIMTQADGHYTRDGDLKFHFSKTRKIERCKRLLRGAEIIFTIHEKKNSSVITIKSRILPLWLRTFRDKTFKMWLLDESADVILDELEYWDAYRRGPNSIQYTTTNKQNADIIQALANLSGRSATIVKKVRANKNWNDAYIVNIWLNPGGKNEIKNKPQIIDYKGKVYCAETKTGFFLVRRNGKVWITGNSGRLVQFQNLPQNHLKDLELARGLIKEGRFEDVELLFGNVPGVLSELIRTNFIPEEKHRFIVADFSAIEARVISWLAGEKWRLEVFVSHGKIYEAAASMMFHVPVESITKGSPLRQKGKISELACIAEGELVLTDKGLVSIEDITLDHKLWDGEEWVTHGGVIYKGEKEVIEYEGLRATEDHLVWIQGQSKPVLFGYAASSSSHLLQTGNGRQAIRVGQNNKFGKTVEREMESLLCSNPVCQMQEHSVDKSRKFKSRYIKRMPKLLSTKTDTKMAGPKANRGKTKMSESKASRVPSLWRKRNRIQIPFNIRGRHLDYKECRKRESKFRDGSNRQQWALRKRQYSICTKDCKSRQSKSYCSINVESKVLALCKKCSNKEVIIRNDKRANYCRCRKSNNRKEKKLETYRSQVRVYDILNAGRNNRFTVSGKLVHNCGYGGGVGALKSMGALEMGVKEHELQGLIDNWRSANTHIVKFWWDVDRSAVKAVKERSKISTQGIIFTYKSGMLFVTLPSGRNLVYVKPRIALNKFGREGLTYEGIGTARKWERIETYGPKIVENIVQAVSRDLLAEAMLRLDEAGYKIVAHVHDEVICEVPIGEGSVEEMCAIMAESPKWVKGLPLKADGYECNFYMKD
jgi:hypothetical protein